MQVWGCTLSHSIRTGLDAFSSCFKVRTDRSGWGAATCHPGMGSSRVQDVFTTLIYQNQPGSECGFVIHGATMLPTEILQPRQLK